MRRFGDPESFLGLIEQIRSQAPLAGIRSNVIVGFPGETEDDLATLCDFLVDARMDVVGVFGYSDEDGTEAESYDGKLDEDEIRERTEHVTRLVEELTSQRAEERIGERGRGARSRVVDGDAAEGRAAHQGPEVDGTTTVDRAARRARRSATSSARSSSAPTAPTSWPRRSRDRPASAEHPPSNWNLPNALTTLRIVMVPFFGWALLVDGGDSVLWRCVAWVLFVVAMITDKVDGDIARSRNLVTELRQDRRPDRRQGADRDGVRRALDHRRAVVVGDDRGAGPRVGDHPAAASG